MRCECHNKSERGMIVSCRLLWHQSDVRALGANSLKRECLYPRPLLPVKGNVCLCPPCVPLKPVLPSPSFPCGLRLISAVFTAALGGALHYTLNHLKDQKLQKTPSAANSLRLCGSSLENKQTQPPSDSRLIKGPPLSSHCFELDVQKKTTPASYSQLLVS